MSTTNWKLNVTEKGYSCGQNSFPGDAFNVYVPKILPLISFDHPKTSVHSLSTSGMLNASTCKPPVSANVTTRNYIRIPIAKSSISEGILKNVKYSAHDQYGGIHVVSASYQYNAAHGTAFKIEIHNQNVDKMSVVSEYDQ